MTILQYSGGRGRGDRGGRGGGSGRGGRGQRHQHRRPQHGWPPVAASRSLPSNKWERAPPSPGPQAAPSASIGGRINGSVGCPAGKETPEESRPAEQGAGTSTSTNTSTASDAKLIKELPTILTGRTQLRPAPAVAQSRETRSLSWKRETNTNDSTATSAVEVAQNVSAAPSDREVTVPRRSAPLLKGPQSFFADATSTKSWKRPAAAISRLNGNSAPQEQSPRKKRIVAAEFKRERTIRTSSAVTAAATTLQKVGRNKLVPPAPLRKYAVLDAPSRRMAVVLGGAASKRCRDARSAPSNYPDRHHPAAVKRVQLLLPINTNEICTGRADLDDHCMDDDDGNDTSIETGKNSLSAVAAVALTDHAYRFKRNAKARSLVRVQPDATSTPICPSFLRGRACTDASCLKRHDVPKEFGMPACFYFQQKGLCYKDDCPFRHVKVNPRAEVCPSFALLGFCEEAGCAMQHIRPAEHHHRTWAAGAASGGSSRG